VAQAQYDTTIGKAQGDYDKQIPAAQAKLVEGIYKLEKQYEKELQLLEKQRDKDLQSYVKGNISSQEYGRRYAESDTQKEALLSANQSMQQDVINKAQKTMASATEALAKARKEAAEKLDAEKSKAYDDLTAAANKAHPEHAAILKAAADELAAAQKKEAERLNNATATAQQKRTEDIDAASKKRDATLNASAEQLAAAQKNAAQKLENAKLDLQAKRAEAETLAAQKRDTALNTAAEQLAAAQKKEAERLNNARNVAQTRTEASVADAVAKHDAALNAATEVLVKARKKEIETAEKLSKAELDEAEKLARKGKYAHSDSSVMNPTGFTPYGTPARPIGAGMVDVDAMGRKLASNITSPITRFNKALELTKLAISGVTKAFSTAWKILSTGYQYIKRFVVRIGEIYVALSSAAMGAAIKLSGDYEQSILRLHDIFGASSVNIEKFSTSLNKLSGVSATEAARSIASMARILEGYGLDTTLEKTTIDLGTIAQDIASDANVELSRALEAITSAFAGITKPLDNLGVRIRQKDISAELDKMAESNDLYYHSLEESGKRAFVVAKLLESRTENRRGFAVMEQDSLAVLWMKFKATGEDTMRTLGDQFVGTVRNLLTEGISAFNRIQGVLSSGLLENAAADIYYTFSTWIQQMSSAVNDFGELGVGIFQTMGAALRGLSRLAYSGAQGVQNLIGWVGVIDRAVHNLTSGVYNAISWIVKKISFGRIDLGKADYHTPSNPSDTMYEGAGGGRISGWHIATEFMQRNVDANAKALGRAFGDERDSLMTRLQNQYDVAIARRDKLVNEGADAATIQPLDDAITKMASMLSAKTVDSEFIAKGVIDREHAADPSKGYLNRADAALEDILQEIVDMTEMGKQTVQDVDKQYERDTAQNKYQNSAMDLVNVLNNALNPETEAQKMERLEERISDVTSIVQKFANINAQLSAMDIKVDGAAMSDLIRNAGVSTVGDIEADIKTFQRDAGGAANLLTQLLGQRKTIEEKQQQEQQSVMLDKSSNYQYGSNKNWYELMGKSYTNVFEDIKVSSRATADNTSVLTQQMGNVTVVAQAIQNNQGRATYVQRG